MFSSLMSQSSTPVNEEIRVNAFMAESILTVFGDVVRENGEHKFKVLTEDPFFLKRSCPSASKLVSRVV